MLLLTSFYVLPPVETD